MYSPFFNLGARWEGGGLTPRTGLFPSGKDPVPIVYRGKWAPGPVWTCAKIPAPQGFGLPDRSESLYLLSYPGPRPLPGLIMNYNTERFRGKGLYFGS